MHKRTPMQVSIEKLLKAHGLLAEFKAAAEKGELFHTRFEMDNFDPLVVELLPGTELLNSGGMTVSVAHYFEQYGDLMSDPEIVFDLATWEPLEITQSPTATYRRKFHRRGDKIMVDVYFRRDVMPLANVWAKNIRHQGWDRAEVVRC